MYKWTGGNVPDRRRRLKVKIPPTLSLRGSPRPRPARGEGTRTTERSERKELTLVKSVRFAEPSQPGWRLKKRLMLSAEVRLWQDSYEMLRGADLIWDKTGEKQQRGRKEAKLL